MNVEQDIYLNVDDRTERLISRLLDGEISAEEHGELNAILATSADARALLEDYRRIDALSAQALVSQTVAPGVTLKPAVAVRQRHHGLWLVAAGAVMAAAAVVLFSLAPAMWRDARPDAQRLTQNNNPAKAIPQISIPEQAGQMVNFRNDGMPVQRSRVLDRSLIGIPSKDKNVIYLYEVNKQSTMIRPVAGEF